MEKIKITLVEDYNLFREGIKFLLSQYKEIEIIDETINGNELILSLEKKLPDLLLIDIPKPEMAAISAIKKVVEQYPMLKIIVLSQFDDQQTFYKMILIGIHGFIAKNSKVTELVRAIKEVMVGNNYFSNSLLKSVILNLTNKKSIVPNDNVNKFTQREKEILQLLCKGLTSSEIAEKLFISKKTVDGHKYNLLKKTGKKNTVTLVLHAVKNEIIEI